MGTRTHIRKQSRAGQHRHTLTYTYWTCIHIHTHTHTHTLFTVVHYYSGNTRYYNALAVHCYSGGGVNVPCMITRMPCERYRGQPRSLMYLCHLFRTLLNSLVSVLLLRERERERENSNLNSKTLFYKDQKPVWQLVLVKLLMSRYQITGIIYIHVQAWMSEWNVIYMREREREFYKLQTCVIKFWVLSSEFCLSVSVCLSVSLCLRLSVCLSVCLSLSLSLSLSLPESTHKGVN